MMHRATAAVLVALALLTASCAGSDGKGSVRTWSAEVFEPAMREVHDARLAPWQPATALASLPPAAIREGCAEAVRRLNLWDERLRGAPDQDLSTALDRFVDAERRFLDDCISSGEAKPPADLLAPVLERLRDIGITFPEG